MDEAGSLVATFGHESALDWAILRNASIFISDFNRFYVYVSSILVWQFPHRGTTTSLSILKIHLEFLSKIDSTAVFTRWNHFSNEAQSHLARLSFCFHSCADVLFQSPFRKPYDFSFFASVLSLRFAFSSSVQICTLYTKTLLRIVVWMLAKRMGGVMCHQGFPCCLELFWERDPGTQQSFGIGFSEGQQDAPSEWSGRCWSPLEIQALLVDPLHTGRRRNPLLKQIQSYWLNLSQSERDLSFRKSAGSVIQSNFEELNCQDIYLALGIRAQCSQAHGLSVGLQAGSW